MPRDYDESIIKDAIAMVDSGRQPYDDERRILYGALYSSPRYTINTGALSAPQPEEPEKWHLNTPIPSLLPCPSIETLSAYVEMQLSGLVADEVEGALKDTECRRVDEHLNFCPRCYELVSETREVLRWMEDSRKSQAEVRDEYQELYSRQQKDRTGDRNMETPSVGRIVHYVLDDPPRHLAAIITEVLNSVGSVNLSAFPPLRGSVPFYAVQYSARMSPGTWHYPERVTTSSDHESEEVPAPRTAGE